MITITILLRHHVLGISPYLQDDISEPASPEDVYEEVDGRVDGQETVRAVNDVLDRPSGIALRSAKHKATMNKMS